MDARRRRYSSGGPWEPLVGYSRAVRVGDHVFVSGTTGPDTHRSGPAVEDAGKQARKALQRIGEALHALGSSLEDVVRTRIYLTQIDDWRDVGRVHAEVFAKVRPAATLVEVRRLIDPAMRVEIEVDALAAPPARSRKRNSRPPGPRRAHRPSSRRG